ncbi:1,4-alpha-glucan branching protein GlgB [Ruminococcus sp. NK3A76]|uniref:1,4-alpha-glucan branching protein GlgB n=1 Tax=Ruminococcus sp. NK3A76 TaxID=877411 RepID=UPI00056C5A81|nr:1,4-alpha-glucan branching protein GlgB [Ruminococcus sp. NK3A76]
MDIITQFIEGRTMYAYEELGSHIENGGVRYTTFAPHAKSVQLICNGDRFKMNRDDRGVWSIFLHDSGEGDIYKYAIEGPDGEINDRADPFAFYSEERPKNASIVYDIDKYEWHDEGWMKDRSKNYDRPMNIYEVQFGSWRIKPDTDEDHRFYSYDEMSEMLIPYVKDMGYTHIELMPMTEYPFDGSWGYQVSGYFSATSRYGSPDGLMRFIDKCHQEGIGVILDYVPVHFVRDFYSLHIYDGGFLFESDYENERYSEWNTALFDYTKPHVLSFVKSSINFWCEKYHVDGLRYDAVACLLYRWGKKENAINDSGIWFLKNTNYDIRQAHPGVMLFAEDSTDYPKVTAPVQFGGLGFDYKWDLGFMNDTINYIKTPAYDRRYHHNKMNFSMSYFYNDLFILPYSHDEVVHGKKTMLDKVFGMQNEQFATIRALYAFQIAHPGKKLGFMGNEIGEYMEWRPYKELGWNLLTYPLHDSLHEYIKALNHIYLNTPALYECDYDPAHFRWIDADNSNQSIFSFARSDINGGEVYCVFNFSGVPQTYYLKVRDMRTFEEILCSDRDIYSGSNMTHGRRKPYGGRLALRLAPFSAYFFRAIDG